MAHICLSQSHPTVDPHPSNDETPRANIPQGNFMLESSGVVRQPSLFSLNLLPYGDVFAFRSRPIHHQMTTVLSDCGQLFESRGSSRRPSPPQGLIMQPRRQPAGAFMRGRRTREPAINHIASWLHVHKPTARASGTCLGEKNTLQSDYALVWPDVRRVLYRTCTQLHQILRTGSNGLVVMEITKRPPCSEASATVGY